jgi:hypothetical protein
LAFFSVLALLKLTQDFKQRKAKPSDNKIVPIKGNCIINSPPHYTRGRYEVIDIIEDAIQDAPSPEAAMLHSNVLRYSLRLWCKDNAAVDARKAKWYLKRLISKLEGESRED